MEKFSSSAKVIDGTLILTLPDAIRPVVWQMQLGQTKSSAIEVRDQADGNWMLVLKTPRQDVIEIAPFANKDAAIRALIAVSRAMEKAHGQLGPGPSPYPVPALIRDYPRGSWLGRLVRGVLYAFLALVLLIALTVGFLWLSQDNQPQGIDPTALEAPVPSSAQLPETVPPEAAAAPAGAPVSADDFLNSQ